MSLSNQAQADQVLRNLCAPRRVERKKVKNGLDAAMYAMDAFDRWRDLHDKADTVEDAEREAWLEFRHYFDEMLRLTKDLDMLSHLSLVERTKARVLIRSVQVLSLIYGPSNRKELEAPPRKSWWRG